MTDDLSKYIKIIKLGESPIAAQGDWKTNTPTSSISEFIFEQNWEIVGQLYMKAIADILYVAKFKDDKVWVIGKYTEVSSTNEKPRFEIYAQITLAIENSLGNKLGYGKLYQVKEVGVDEKYRGYNLAKSLYKILIRNYDFSIMGDYVQYFGARKLWASLSRDTDVAVDIIDVNTDTIIAKDVILHHGNYDEDFDKAVWSYRGDKSHIILVLRDIVSETDLLMPV